MQILMTGRLQLGGGGGGGGGGRVHIHVHLWNLLIVYVSVTTTDKGPWTKDSTTVCSISSVSTFHIFIGLLPSVLINVYIMYMYTVFGAH